MYQRYTQEYGAVDTLKASIHQQVSDESGGGTGGLLLLCE
jgi:hypothetical protein